MKKYMTPSLEITEILSIEMMALSVDSSNYADDSTPLVKDEAAMDIWDVEE